MTELNNYMSSEDLVFNNDIENGIHSGGFSVKSAMMKLGISPIMTFNSEQIGGGNKVSELFNDIVIPNWTLSYGNKYLGGKYKDIDYKSDSEDDVIEDDLHEKLLDLVREHENTIKKSKKITRKFKLKKNNKTKRM
jgi:hypothetical protein